MRKDIDMQLATILRVFEQHAQFEFVEIYVRELRSGKLAVPEIKFAINKLIQYCEQHEGWKDEQAELEEILGKINYIVQCNEDKEKSEAPVNKFWISFYEWMHTELPSQNWLYPQYVEYDNWNGGTYNLNIDYNSIFRRFLGVPYDNRYDNKDTCKLSDIKSLIEIFYKELIQVQSRYNFTIEINKMLNRFSMPLELKNGILIKKGYRSTEKNIKIIDFQMLERKIQWSEDKILGAEGLDKHTALNYITDALQYLLSLINALNEPTFTNKNIKQRCGLLANNDTNSKIYSVVSKEISDMQLIVNDYFDIRHNEYLSNFSKTEREPLRDTVFIEYLYNRIYGLVFFIKLKYLLNQSKKDKNIIDRDLFINNESPNKDNAQF